MLNLDFRKVLYFKIAIIEINSQKNKFPGQKCPGKVPEANFNFLLTETYAYRNLSGFPTFCKSLPSLAVAERRDGVPENKEKK